LKHRYRVGMDPCIKTVDLNHIDSIIGIEQVSYPLPWPSSVFIDELQNSWSRLWGYFPHGLNTPIGFMLFWEVYDELHILNIAVHPNYRRRGIARSILRSLLEYGRQGGFKYITLEVRCSNAAARNLYRELNFQVKGIRRGYYSDNNEDALIMAHYIADPVDDGAGKARAASGSYNSNM
jgi:ribosomal-protein-alanine N-acetyltransferase